MSDSGKVIEVHDEQGQLTGCFQMAGGQLHGQATLYGAGRVIAEIFYVRGLRHGEMRSYDENGQLHSIVVHAAGLPQGEASYFHPDGALARTAHYKEGRLHGEVCDFSPGGEQLACERYIEGKKQAAPAKTEDGPAAVPAAAQRKSWLARMVEG